MSEPPILPEFNSVVDDSPLFHQSLKYWTYKSSQVGSAVHDISSSLRDYHETGNKHHASGNTFSEVLSQVSHIFNDDDMMVEPLSKFSDAINRIECYRSMLLTQTQMLGVEPMTNMVKEIEKTKKCKNKLTKLSETMHISWEKFAALPHISNLTEPQHLDRHAHSMITLRQKYQLLLAEYVEHIRDTNTTKKVALLQRVLEHMFAEFSYYNYCCQILKDLEPYMTGLFESLQKKQRDYEQLALLDDSYRREVENKIDAKAHVDRKLFPMGEPVSLNSNSPAHFFNKVGGFISSGVKDLKKSYKDVNAPTMNPKTEETEWEVINEPTKSEGGEETSHFYVPLKTEVSDDSEVPTKDDHVEIIESGEEVLETNIDSSDHVDGIFRSSKVSPIHIPYRFEQEVSEPRGNISKRGYLRIKQRGFHRSKYPLLYFILDKGYGELLTQGQDQKYPRVFARLMLSSVKPCNATDTDRNYCFVLTTSDSEYILQASNSQDYDEWIRELQDGIMNALDLNQERTRSQHRGSSIKNKQDKSDQQCDDVVERIKKIDGNLFCADCDCPQPGWASANIGVVICIECSGVHRGLGVQISKIKSLSLDRWDISLVEFMEANGNSKMNKILEANLTIPKITKLSSKKERLDYITAKYVGKLFSLPATEDSGSPIKEEICEDGEVTLSDLSDNEQQCVFDNSVMCLVKECTDCAHGHHNSAK